MLRTTRHHKPARPLIATATVFGFGMTTAMAAPAVSVTNPWFRYLLPSIPAGGYMTLSNATGKPVVLTGAHSSACGMTMLHKSVTRDGVDQMLPVKSITIPAHGSFTFRPGRYHVMCMHPHMKPGETVPVELMFDGLPPVTAQFTVYGAAGKPAGK